MAIKRKATAVWQGSGLKGKGTLNSSNNFFDNTPFNFKARFENEDGKLGTNPEELLAAAHSGCFTMALSFGIVGAGYEAERLEANAEVVLDKIEGTDDFEVTGITLHLEGKVPGMSEEQFMELANGAKENCPISKALSAVPINLNTKFVA